MIWRRSSSAKVLAIYIIVGFTGMPVFAADGLTLSGQLSRALMLVDDGVEKQTSFVDNAGSSSRLGLRGDWQTTGRLRYGFFIETAFTANPSNRVSMAQPNGILDVTERHADFFLKGNLGLLRVGRGDGAANGGMDVDVSGTSLANHSSMTDLGGNFIFRGRDGSDDGPAIRRTMRNLDFESRYLRLRLDPPAVGPIRIALSAGEKQDVPVYEFALRTRQKHPDSEWRAAIGYSVQQRDDRRGDEQTYGGSISARLRSGFTVTASLGRSHDEREDRPTLKYAYLKLGYTTGIHSIGINYGIGENFNREDDQSIAYGVGYVYQYNKLLSYFATLTQHRLDREGESYEAINVLAIGARLRFSRLPFGGS